MALLGNLLWILTGGWVTALSWLVAAGIAVLTIVLIPYVPTLLRLSLFSLVPFGRELVDKRVLDGDSDLLAKGSRGLLNLIWFLLIGWWLALWNAVIGLVLCLTLILFPFEVQVFKLAGAALWPVGTEVVPKAEARYAADSLARARIDARRARRFR